MYIYIYTSLQIEQLSPKVPAPLNYVPKTSQEPTAGSTGYSYCHNYNHNPDYIRDSISKVLACSKLS